MCKWNHMCIIGVIDILENWRKIKRKTGRRIEKQGEEIIIDDISRNHAKNL
ncbi:hypothetical protein LguiA_024238 [Lonicera macranthoides]